MTAPPTGPVLVVLAAGRAKRYGGGLKPLAEAGPGGETILDMVASDAVSSGFSAVVVVVSPESRDPIVGHVESAWPEWVDVRFATQQGARGTVDAVLAAWPELGDAPRFGVANADDLYGTAALEILASHVGGSGSANALVGFRLDRATIGDEPVTRGVCQVSPDGYLTEIDERRQVTPKPDGTFGTGDGRSPRSLEPTTLVSMNLWGFTAELHDDFERAMAISSADEVLLPELVGELIVRPNDPRSFAVLPTDSRCVGVTHPDDLALVQADVKEQIERGDRPAALWSGGPEAGTA